MSSVRYSLGQNSFLEYPLSVSLLATEAVTEVGVVVELQAVIELDFEVNPETLIELESLAELDTEIELETVVKLGAEGNALDLKRRLKSFRLRVGSL